MCANKVVTGVPCSPLQHRITDAQVRAYVDALGRRLVDKIPENLRQPAFHYSFEVVNDERLLSLLLPGGPIFVSRGIIEIAHAEGELAAVIAHELSHVVLRHGTVQATKAEKFQVGAILGRTIGAVAAEIGEGVAAKTAAFGVRTYFLMYEPELERQAALLAQPLLEAAGYNAKESGAIFRAIANPESVAAGGNGA